MASYATYKDLPIEKRTADATKIRTKYPDMIPVLLDHNLELKKFKYLVPNYFSFAELMATVRMQMSIMPPDVGLFLFVNADGDILREQAQYWGKRGVHYHQFLTAGENTLNSLLAIELFELVQATVAIRRFSDPE